RVERVPVDHTTVHVIAAEVIAPHDRPAAPRIVAAIPVHVDDREEGPVVPPERTPADVTRRVGPGDPGGAPGAAGNPEPRAGRESPAAVVMRRPCPRSVANPDPAPGPQRRPAAVIVGSPADRDCRIPHIAVL